MWLSNIFTGFDDEEKVKIRPVCWLREMLQQKSHKSVTEFGKKKMGERKGENLKDRKKFVVVGGKNSVFTFFLSDIRMVQSPMHAMYGYR